MTASSRTDKLFPALSARERALAVLRAWKDGGEEDRQMRATMPNSQVPEFNRLIGVMNGVNERLGPYLLLLRANVEQLGLIDGLLSTLILWMNDVFALELYIFRNVGEPVTETEFDAIKKRCRRREPRPDWGLRYEVFPDKEAARVRGRRDERAHVRAVIGHVARDAILGDPPNVEPHNAFGDEIWAALIDRLRERLIQYWIDMRAIEVVLGQAAEEFDGEDPVIPEVRAIVDWMRPELAELHAKLTTVYAQKFDLPEPAEVNIKVIRKIAHLDSGDFDVQVTIETVQDAVRAAIRASEDDVSGKPGHELEGGE